MRHKTVKTEKRQGTPDTQSGKEGKRGGTGPAVEEAREPPVQCPHRQSHTNRTLDSLNTVYRPNQGPSHACWGAAGLGSPGDRGSVAVGRSGVAVCGARSLMYPLAASHE